MRNERVHPGLIRAEEPFRPAAVNETASPAVTKSRSETIFVFTALSTAESAIRGRSGSIRSSASAGRL